jgi:hypothetical protein
MRFCPNLFRLGRLAMLLGLVLLARPALAAVYTSEAAFRAAHPGIGTVTFEGLTTNTPPNHEVQVGQPWTHPTGSGIVFTGQVLTVVNQTVIGTPLPALIDDDFPGYIGVTLSPVPALGIRLGSWYGAFGTFLDVVFLNGVTELYRTTVSASYLAPAFLGLDGVGPITGVMISSDVDNFDSPLLFMVVVPEPASLGLLGFGLAGLGLARRARARQLGAMRRIS